MFHEIVETDFFKKEENIATNTVIKSDRIQYTPVFKKIQQELINDKTLIFSNLNKIIDYYKGSNKSLISPNNIQTSMIIYSTHTRRTTTLITNIIHEYFGKYVQMRSIIPNEEYEIMYNLRSIVRVYRIDRYKDIDLSILFNTITINKNIYFPADIELMDIYHKLYLPNFRDEWCDLLVSEPLLFNTLLKNKTGGNKCSDCKVKRRIDISNIQLLMIEYLHNENFVLIGHWAHNILLGKTDQPTRNIQVISENPIDMDYENIARCLSKYTNYGIFYKKRKMYVPKNTRIVKYTLYIKYPTIKTSTIDKPFMDIYNCGSYELTPYIEKKYKNSNLRIGNIYVQLYYSMVDMWLLKLLTQLRGITNEYFLENYNYYITIIKQLIHISLMSMYGRNLHKPKWLVRRIKC